MKFILPVILFYFVSFTARAQDSEIEKMMSKRVVTRSDASYNIAMLLPRLYSERKDDTIQALINYTLTNFGTLPELVPFMLLNSIKKRTFKEEIKYVSVKFNDTARKISDSDYYKASIVSYYLLWYKDNIDIIGKDKYPLYYRKAYSDYFAFLVPTSKDLLKIKDLSPLEKWILQYFIDPWSERMKELNGTDYNGTILQKSWKQYDKKMSELSGFGYGLIGGLWMPTGNLSVVGNHPFFGITMGGRTKSNFLVDLRIDFRFIQAPNHYIVPADTFKFSTNHFSGMNAGLDFGYELYRKRNALDIIGGIAWEYFETLTSHQTSTYNLSSDAGTFNTFNANAGLAYRFYLTHNVKKNAVSNSYISLQARYNFLFFNNNGGADFSGNAWTVGVTYGFFSKKTAHYYIDFDE